jgi:hypothetical protein
MKPKIEQHRCRGVYVGMTGIGGQVVLVAYRCSCGEVWADEMSRDAAVKMHPHLAGKPLERT